MSRRAESQTVSVQAEQIAVPGRDEMNLAEFPIASLGDRVPEGVKTLEFSDIIRDKGRGNLPVIRKLTVSASDKYGLPTAKDDEVLLALIQLTAEQNFANRKVFFTRYQLLKELGWKDTAKNYKRVERSLKLWVGVTLYYDSAWWAKGDQCWVNRSFHFLSDLHIIDGQTRRARLSRDKQDRGTLQSSFSWDETMFESFKAGNLKYLDRDLIRSLKSSTAKRMYRYLSKHLYLRSKLKYELKHFACEKIGLSKSYHTGETKRRLRTAIHELEAAGYFRAMPDEQRFTRDGRQWFVHFEKNGAKSEQQVLPGKSEGIAKQLIDRGVRPEVARQFARQVPEKDVKEKIEYFDHLLRHNKLSQNPPGFLVTLLKSADPIPDTFETNAARTKRQQSIQYAAQQKQQARQKQEAEAIRKAQEQRQWLQREWAKLKPGEQAAIEQDIEKKVEAFLGRTEGPAANAFRESARCEALRLRKQGTAG